METGPGVPSLVQAVISPAASLPALQHFLPKLLLLPFKPSVFQTCRTIYSLSLHALRLFPYNFSQSSFSRLNLSSFNIIQLVGQV